MLADLLPRIDGKFVIIPTITLLVAYPLYILLWLAVALKGVESMDNIIPELSNEALLAGLAIGLIMAFVLVAYPAYIGAFKKNAITDGLKAMADESPKNIDYKFKFSPRYAVFMAVLTVVSALTVLAVICVASVKYSFVTSTGAVAVIELIGAPVCAYILDTYALHEIADGAKTVKEQFEKVKADYAAFRARAESDGKTDTVSGPEDVASAISAAMAAAAPAIASAVMAAMKKD